MPGDRLSISASVIADSVYKGSRLTTFELTFPRFILSEFNTHRVLSRNSASSRAIPVWKRLADILESPFVPMSFGKNKGGMQSTEEISEEDSEFARNNWLAGRDVAVIQAYMLAGGEGQILKDSKENPRARALCEQMRQLMFCNPEVTFRMRNLSAGVHKQHANRVLEPYAWHTVVTTGTKWRNFYALRASAMAQPEIQSVAIAMAEVHCASSPLELYEGEWHLPFVTEDDVREVSDPIDLARVSTARCARVSYLTHDGVRNLEKDFLMATDLQRQGHTSPFEHPARTADTTGAYFGNYGGNFGSEWIQYRKMLDHENDFSRLISPELLLAGMKGDQKLADFVLSLMD